MIAIEATIVSTAMPQMSASWADCRSIAGCSRHSCLTQTATTVVFGKLSDLIGRKRRDAGRDRSLPVWLDLMWICVVDAVADRLPAGSGHRRGRGSADRHDHCWRPLFGARAGENPRLAGQCVGVVGDPRTARRRAHHPVFFLGLDLLDEFADWRARCGRLLGSISTKRASTVAAGIDHLSAGHIHRRHRRHHGRSDRAFDLGPVFEIGLTTLVAVVAVVAVRPAGAPLSRTNDLA